MLKNLVQNKKIRVSRSHVWAYTWSAGVCSEHSGWAVNRLPVVVRFFFIWWQGRLPDRSGKPKWVVRDIELEWTVFKASIEEAAVKSCGQKVTCACWGGNLKTHWWRWRKLSISFGQEGCRQSCRGSKNLCVGGVRISHGEGILAEIGSGALWGGLGIGWGCLPLEVFRVRPTGQRFQGRPSRPRTHWSDYISQSSRRSWKALRARTRPGTPCYACCYCKAISDKQKKLDEWTDNPIRTTYKPLWNKQNHWTFPGPSLM